MQQLLPQTLLLLLLLQQRELGSSVYGLMGQYRL
jgi:hypothetical protein